jgi:hypothetical protein
MKSTLFDESSVHACCHPEFSLKVVVGLLSQLPPILPHQSRIPGDLSLAVSAAQGFLWPKSLPGVVIVAEWFSAGYHLSLPASPPSYQIIAIVNGLARHPDHSIIYFV